MNRKKEMEIQKSVVPQKILMLAFETTFLLDTQASRGSKRSGCICV